MHIATLPNMYYIKGMGLDNRAFGQLYKGGTLLSLWQLILI